MSSVRAHHLCKKKALPEISVISPRRGQQREVKRVGFINKNIVKEDTI